MTDALMYKAEQILQADARRHAWQRVVAIFAVFVLFVTLYMLRLTAFALEGDTYCGLEPHSHTDACYTSELTCGLEEGAMIGEGEEAHAHTHTELCYTQVLTCTLFEHEHTDACYQAPETEAEAEPETEAAPAWLCQMEEHEHTDACYSETMELICGIEAHTHTEACLAPAETGEEADGTEEGIDTEDAEVEIEDEATPMALRFVKLFEDDQVRITAVYDDGTLPAEATLCASPITAENAPEEYALLLAQAGLTPDAAADLPLVLYRIDFWLDGQIIEPTAPVDINVEFLDRAEFTVGEDMTVLHLADDGAEVLESEALTDANAASFQTSLGAPVGAEAN